MSRSPCRQIRCLVDHISDRRSCAPAMRHHLSSGLLLLCLSLAMLVSTFSHAQTAVQGVVDYPYLGIRLTIPEGWRGREDGDFLILGSDTEAGAVGLTTNEARAVGELKRVADQGWIDEGVQMTRSGEFERIGAEGMGAEFSGTFQGADARAFIAGIINPHGNSVTVIALTTSEVYGPRQVELVREVAESLQFLLPQEAEHNQSWRESLPGKVLTAMDSSHSDDTPYYDASGQQYGAYTSYSSRTTLNLCSNGEFFGASSSSASFDSVGGFGGVHSSGGREGRWQVSSSAAGESLLELTYSNGNVVTYVLSREDGKTYLDGERYYRTVSESCA